MTADPLELAGTAKLKEQLGFAINLRQALLANVAAVMGKNPLGKMSPATKVLRLRALTPRLTPGALMLLSEPFAVSWRK